MRFWESVSNRYFGSSFLGHTTHQDLCSHFIDVTEDLNSTRLYQISMNGPSVTIKFYNEFIKKTQECHHQLIDMGSCSLDIIHGVRFLRTQTFRSVVTQGMFVKESMYNMILIDYITNCTSRNVKNYKIKAINKLNR